MKKTVAFLLVAVMLMLSSCSLLSFEAEPKTFSTAGMSIELTTAFTEKEMRSYTACYDSAHVAVFALKEEFDLMEGLEDLSLKEYAEMVIENNGKTGTKVEKEQGLTYFVFDVEANGKEFTYFSPVFKGDDAFWLFQFSCVSDEYEEYKDDFIKWAKSIEV